MIFQHELAGNGASESREPEQPGELFALSAGSRRLGRWRWAAPDRMLFVTRRTIACFAFSTGRVHRQA